MGNRDARSARVAASIGVRDEGALCRLLAAFGSNTPLLACAVKALILVLIWEMQVEGGGGTMDGCGAVGHVVDLPPCADQRARVSRRTPLCAMLRNCPQIIAVRDGGQISLYA